MAILRFWGYDQLDTWSPREPKWRNHYSHTVPIIATATRRSSKALLDLCQADLESKLPLQQIDRTKTTGEVQSSIHLVHSTFECWHMLNEHFLEHMCYLLRTTIKDRGAQVEAYRKFYAIFSVRTLLKFFSIFSFTTCYSKNISNLGRNFIAGFCGLLRTSSLGN